MSTFHPLYPPTHHVSTRSIPASEATEFLQTFIHWTSSTRPIRNRKHPYNALPVIPFPHSVLNNLRRIEMGLRGEQAPRLKPTRTTAAAAPKKRKWAEETTEGVLVSGEIAAEDAIAEANEDEGSGGEAMEVQMRGREMRMDGEVVPEAPKVLSTGMEGDQKKGKSKGKEERKKEKKERRKEEKKLREEKRRKGGNEEKEKGEDEEE